MDIKRVTVVGAGLMGAGITQVIAAANIKVTMTDVQQSSVDKGNQIIKASLARIAKKQFKDPAGQKEYIDKVMANISSGIDPIAAAQNSDLVIEAIVESIKVKQTLFQSLDKAAPKHAILVSNTSSLPIGDIASATSRKHLVAGLHFFNPVPQMKLVEIVRTAETSEDTYQKLHQFTTALGKSPVTCKDTPGFIVNRLLVPYMMEAIRMVERGDATKEDMF